jgi:acetyl-CoA carboxylase biotin carboxylase subunit
MPDRARRPVTRRKRITRLLIANRGEIALRIIRTCRELGIRSVVAHSQADASALPTRLADEAICVGPASARASYLNASMLISAAGVTGCDAVHPGYGFLSENPDFADAVEASGFIFVGPSSATMRLVGDKIEARRRMQAAGVPVVPGSDGPLEGLAAAAMLCGEIGYPVLVKAAAGGGGKGMRVIRRERDLEAGMMLCTAEAKTAFDDARVYVERYIDSARHIEVQVVGDTHGNVAQLGERDCSVQRRHQKLLEEAPAPGLDDEQRARLGDWAVRAAQSTGYVGAGTVEFICDADGHYYFMEMNARLQVEHPVTELVTGVDLVAEQLRVAAGEPVDLGWPATAPGGHAIECRINAEDPLADFQPSPGFIREVRFPGGPGVRVDSHIVSRSEIPPHYDSMIAKLVVWAPDRDQAIARAERALSELRVTGVSTTTQFHQRLLRSSRFRRGRVTTGTVEEVW